MNQEQIDNVGKGVRIFGIVLAVLVVGGLIFSMCHPMGKKPMPMSDVPTSSPS